MYFGEIHPEFSFRNNSVQMLGFSSRRREKDIGLNLSSANRMNLNTYGVLAHAKINRTILGYCHPEGKGSLQHRAKKFGNKKEFRKI